jgi:hypothetical protein
MTILIAILLFLVLMQLRQIAVNQYKANQNDDLRARMIIRGLSDVRDSIRSLDFQSKLK